MIPGSIASPSPRNDGDNYRKRCHVQRRHRPDFRSRSRAARGEPVPRQQPEDELAAGVRRPGDRAGDGGGVPHRRGPAAAFAALLFHPAGRPADSDHLRGRTAARRQELYDPPGHRDPAWQRHLLDHGVVPYRGRRRVRPPGPDAGRAAAGKTHRRGSGKTADVPRDAGLHPPLLRVGPSDRAAPGRARTLFRPEDRRRPHQCLDPDRLETARRSGAAHVRAGLCLGFLAAGRGDGALRPHAVRQADDAGEPRSRDVVSPPVPRRRMAAVRPGFAERARRPRPHPRHDLQAGRHAGGFRRAGRLAARTEARAITRRQARRARPVRIATRTSWRTSASPREWE